MTIKLASIAGWIVGAAPHIFLWFALIEVVRNEIQAAILLVITAMYAEMIVRKIIEVAEERGL